MWSYLTRFPVVAGFMYKRRVAEVILDVCLVTAAYYIAWRLRFDTPAEWAEYVDRFIESLPIVVGAQMVMLFVIGAYRGEWRYFGLMDVVVFGKSVLAGTAAIIVTIVYLYHFQNYSRVVFINYASMLMLMLCASRASFGLIGEFARRRRAGTRLVIYGAGQGARSCCASFSIIQRLPTAGLALSTTIRDGSGCGFTGTLCLAVKTIL